MYIYFGDGVVSCMVYIWKRNLVIDINHKCYLLIVWKALAYAFSAWTLLVGWQEGHPACRNWVVGCWCCYLSVAGCKLAYGPADARLVLPLRWRRGVVVSGVRQWMKLTHVGPGYNWDWWPSSSGYTISGCNQPTRSTQPCIPPGSLNRVPASAGVMAGMSALPGGR